MKTSILPPAPGTERLLLDSPLRPHRRYHLAYVARLRIQSFPRMKVSWCIVVGLRSYLAPTGSTGVLASTHGCLSQSHAA